MNSLAEYTFKFHEDWDSYFKRLDLAIRDKVLKKLEQLRHAHPSRHLGHGTPIFVEEVGQHRICFGIDETQKMKTFYFVGDHKEYEKWYKRLI